MKTKRSLRWLALFTAAGISTLLVGCPPSGGGGGEGQAQYDLGFVAGYAEDGEYWQGYDDSWDTRDGGTIYYSGSEIPYYDELSYDAGYWDGVWYAYNDGYFVAYDYAFTIGFSEGYDLAYYPDYLDFLASDQHVEWLDGGFTDGYNDGFSEGRILGAADYRDGVAYDWFDAMWWYRDGNDAYIAELDLGTGELGPVVLYEYGTDPYDYLKSAEETQARTRSGHPELSIRNNGTDERAAAKQTAEPDISYRSLTSEAQSALNVRPATSPRSTTPLEVEGTWLQRVQQYRNSVGQGKQHQVERKAAN